MRYHDAVWNSKHATVGREKRWFFFMLAAIANEQRGWFYSIPEVTQPTVTISTIEVTSRQLVVAVHPCALLCPAFVGA